MSKTKPLFKKMWMLLAFLFCSVVSANAANITYSLTTHVDGRTMTATADVAAGADLLSSMPQTLWRAYCTYTFRNEAGEVITTAPDNGGTVSVDYEFDPPFIVSQEGQDPIWHNLRTYNSGGSNNYMLYLKQRNYPGYEGVFGYKVTRTTTPTYGKTGIDPNAEMGILGDCQWALYGDAYNLNIRINDASYGENGWMQWGSTTSASNLKLGAKPRIGWQLYVNKTTKQNKQYKWVEYPTMMLGVPNTNLYVEFQNVNYKLQTKKIEGEFHFDNQNQLVRNPRWEGDTGTKQDQWWYGFYATPVNTGLDLNYNVTYKILRYDGKWYQDIVKPQVDSYGNGKKLSFPTEYTQDPECEYDYFYKDADFTEKYADDYVMPNTKNIVVYIKETKTEVPGVERTFTQGKWMTLVLPDYSLLEQNGIWGRFLDYVAVESHENAEDGYHWNCDLKFEEVGPNDLIPNRPYLFLPEKIEGADDNTRSKVVTFSLNGTPLTVSHVDPNEPDATITMYGTYEDFELVPCEPQEPKGYKYIYFYFGNPAEGEYNFYTVEKNVTIAPTICYFDIKATKNAQNAPTIGGFGAKFSFFEGTNAINNIEGVKTGADKVYNLNGQQVQGNLQKGIYIVNGKKVLVK